MGMPSDIFLTSPNARVYFFVILLDNVNII